MVYTKIYFQKFVTNSVNNDMIVVLKNAGYQYKYPALQKVKL